MLRQQMLVFGTALWMGWGALGGTSLSLGIAPLLSKKVSNTTIGAKITTIKPDPPESVNKVEQRQIPGTAGKIPVRIYTPQGSGNLPVLVYFHGGGFISGNLDTCDVPLRALTNRAGSIIVSVDYRLAPKHPFPAALDDAYAVTRWVADHAKEIGGDATRIAVGGDSAGGNLAAVVALIAHDRRAPVLVYQVLLYPNTDATMSSASWKELDGPVLTRQQATSSYAQYLPFGTDLKNPYVSPLWAKDLNNLPPALVITAGLDPLRDEGEAYATRLWKAGVPIEATRYNSMSHGFFQMVGVLEQKKLIEQIAAALRTAYAHVDKH